MRTLDLFVHHPEEQMPDKGDNVLVWTKPNQFPFSCVYYPEPGGGWFVHDMDGETRVHVADIVAWCVSPDREEAEASEKL